MRTSVILLALALLLPRPELAAGRRADDPDFGRDVRPILQARCFECHGPEKQKGKLRFDRRRGVFGADEAAWVVRPGQPEASELMRRVRLLADDLDVMPPDGPPLTRRELDTLRAWIAAGADWAAEVDEPVAHRAGEELRPPADPMPSPSTLGRASFEPAAFAVVRGILASRCFACHGPDEATREAGLRLDTAAGAKEPGRKGRAAVVPGDPAASLLIERVRHADEDTRMPPADVGPRLEPGEIELVRRWIADGAEWETHWSFRPAVRRDPPTVELDRVRNDVDRFVLARLAERGLSPSPQADRYTLARRVSLDLTGLPPDPNEVDAFVADDAPDGYERYVDRLLDDPAFGERWASVWLDQARYADTKGYEKDARRTMWPYRDWVIRALNADMPFDRFTREQLAGDLLPNATDETLLATAFHRNTMTNDEGGTDDEEFRVAAVVDRVNTTMQVWTGLTFGCAQCHSHKYDPISNREYYELFAVFDQTADADREDEAPLLLVATDAQREELSELDAAAAETEHALERETALAEARAAVWLDELQHARSAPPAIAPVLWETLDDVPAPLWRDGQATHVDGVVARAVSFDGRRAIDLDATGASGNFERDRPFTVAFWLEREGGGVHVPIARIAPGDAHRGWDVYVEDGRVRVHLIHAWPDNVVRVASGDTLPEGRWTHVAVTYDGSSAARGLRVYVNGRESRTTATHDSLTETIRTDAPLMLGRRFGDPSMVGALDDLRIYDRALDPSSIRALVHHGASELVRSASEGERAALDRIALDQDDAYVTARARRELAVAEADAFRAKLPRVPVMRALADDARRTTHVQRRGNYRDLGVAVEAAPPRAFPPSNASGAAGAASVITATSPFGRRELADWLTDSRNPLTARVQVNRVWEQLFGVGLVDTSEDFGTQGSPPSHPELLDWLALEYVERGWSLKELCRLVVTSATYRQASSKRAHGSELDPGNRWLWRGPRHRLSAEMVRDQALAVSGLLSRTMYGPPVFPPQPAGVWSVVYSGDRWSEDEGENRSRRALYTFWRRTSPYPSMTTFDAPSREFCVARRIRTNTPLQALVTLNDPVFVEAAQALARRVVHELPGASPTARAAYAFRWCTGRPASALEVEALVELFRSELAFYGGDSVAAAAMSGSGRGLDPADAPDPRDAATLAAWTVVGNILLNLDEVLVKG